MKSNLLLLFLLLNSLFGFSETPQKTRVYPFSQERIDAYKSQKEFQYKSNIPIANNAWETFKNRLWTFIRKFFSNKGAMPAIRIILLAFAILFILMRLLGMNTNTFFGKKQSDVKAIDYYGEISNITSVNFEEEAQNAFKQNDMRLAVRFLFLNCLKQL